MILFISNILLSDYSKNNSKYDKIKIREVVSASFSVYDDVSLFQILFQYSIVLNLQLHLNQTSIYIFEAIDKELISK